jgi:ABC-type uncharacterized transport system substrate-binding protein
MFVRNRRLFLPGSSALNSVCCFEAHDEPKRASHVIRRSFLIVGVALTAIAVTGAGAFAHPHVWVTVKSELVYAPDGSLTDVRHAWTFDDMFSTFAIQGLKSKTKGEFTREELAPLAETNVTSLKEYEYFTYAKANGKQVEFVDPPADYYLDFDKKESVLTLNFTVPLKRPVKAKDFNLEVYDREFFIDFSLAEKEPARLVRAPAQCKLTVRRPPEMNVALAQQLSRLGPDRQNPLLTIGAEYRNRISVKCP